MIKRRNSDYRMSVTLISTFYSLEPVMVAITKLSPEKLILLINEDVGKKITIWGNTTGHGG